MSNPGRNCIDIIEPYAAAVTAEGMPPVQFLGGVGSVALTDATSLIFTDTREIAAPSTLWLPQYRPEGTLRDIETLALSANPEDIARVQACAEEHIAGQLVVETFGIKDIERVDGQVTDPLGKAALMTFVSDRYANPDPSADDKPMIKALFPFAAPIHPEMLEPWSLTVEGRTMAIPVPPVGTVILNYLTRSISGARPKDAAKLEKMAAAIFEKSPETLDWIMDGPGREQFEFARILHTLREPKRRPETLTIGQKLDLNVLPYHELREHPQFLLRDEDSKTQDRALRVARFKSRALHGAEKHLNFLVGPWQKYVEPRIGSVLHNDTGTKKP